MLVPNGLSSKNNMIKIEVVPGVFGHAQFKSSLCFGHSLLEPLNWTINGREIQLICYIINSQIMENENCLLILPIPITIPYDAIFSKNWCSVLFCLVFSTGQEWFTQVLLSSQPGKMIFCIRLSVPIQTETDILLYKCCHCLVKGSHDLGLLIQHFCSMDGRIQWLEPMKVFAGF